jgi:5'-methylthioadenosine phosphorylase
MVRAAAGEAEVGVIGGSGFYGLLDDASEVTVETPFGPPSSPVAVGHVGGRRVAFLARHGTRHTLAPHRINFRANLWALRELGVRRVIGPCAVGSLRSDVQPGDFMVLDQLVDHTWGRAGTFLDGPVVEHVAFADPYCAELSSAVAEAAGPDITVHPRGTVAVINGPRFSTRAESTWFRRAGWDVVNMTQSPEAYLARELGMCYAGLALVTDYDTGVEGGEPGLAAGDQAVTMEAVLAVLADNVARTRALLFDAIPAIPTGFACTCADSGAPSLRRGR